MLLNCYLFVSCIRVHKVVSYAHKNCEPLLQVYQQCADNHSHERHIQDTFIMKHITLLLTLFMSLLITACGGGASGVNKENIVQATNTTNFSLQTVDISSGQGWNINNCPTIKTSKTGINLSTPNYFTGQIVFANLLKHSNIWKRPYNTNFLDTPISLDSDGYPIMIEGGESLTKKIHDDIWGRDIVNDNVYVLLYDGEAEFSLNIDHTILNQAPGRIVYQINKQGALTLTLKSTNPANYAKNMRFVSIDDEETHQAQSFRKDFLRMWSGFPTVRYMDWLETNNSETSQWSQRTTKNNLMQSQGAGVAYEYIIELSNTTNTNPWITIPHQADDNYVRQLATLFKNTLNPNLTVYIEYSNETWNSTFTQTAYMNNKATELGLDNGTGSVNGRYYYAKRTYEIMDIWSDVYINELKSRYVRVLASQFANLGVSNKVLSYGVVNDHIDALAVGSYFGGGLGRIDTVDQTLSQTPAQIAQYLLDVELPKNKDLMQQQKTIADTFGVRLVAYEAGQHLLGSRDTHPTFGKLNAYQPLTDLLIEANRTPLMKNVYLKYLQNWQEISGDVILLFDNVRSPSKFGSWGLLEIGSQSIASAPKASAVYQSMCQ